MLSFTTHWVYDEVEDSSDVKSGVASFILYGLEFVIAVKSFDDYWKIKKIMEYAYDKGAEDKAEEVFQRLLGI